MDQAFLQVHFSTKFVYFIVLHVHPLIAQDLSS